MFNPDIKKMLEGCNSRYSLVSATAKRARQILQEAKDNEEQLDEKAVSLAMEDIANGKYVIEEPEELKSNI